MVSEATINKYANELLALYVSLYTDKYGSAPSMNRYKYKWGFKAMYEDLGPKPAREVIEYYFKTTRPGHPLEHLLYNYEKLNQIVKDIAKDEVDRAEWRKKTEQRVKEWEQNHGNK